MSASKDWFERIVELRTNSLGGELMKKYLKLGILLQLYFLWVQELPS